MYTRFRISEADYLAAMRLHHRMRSLHRPLFIGSSVLLVLFAVFGPAQARPALYGLFGVVAALLLLSRLLVWWIARRHYRNYKAMQDEFGIALAEDGIRFQSLHAEGTVVWDQIHQWREDARFILVYPMPQLFHIVPKSLAQQGFDIQALAAQLRQRMGPPR